MIYRELKLNKKETLTVVRLINLYRNNKKIKLLKLLFKDLNMVNSGQLKEDAELLYDLSLFYLQVNKVKIKEKISQVLSSKSQSPRKLYIISKFYGYFDESDKMNFQKLLGKLKKAMLLKQKILLG